MSEPKPMTNGRLAALRRTIEQVSQRHWAYREGAHPASTAELLAELADELLDAHDFWRSQVHVAAEHVEATGVTRAHIEAWLDVNGWKAEGEDRFGWVTYIAPNGDSVEDCLDLWKSDGSVAMETTIMFIADYLDRPTMHILDEMAAMEVSGG